MSCSGAWQGAFKLPWSFGGCEGRVRHGWYEHGVRVSWGWRGVFNWWPQNIVREGQERVRHCNLASGLARRTVSRTGVQGSGHTRGVGRAVFAAGTINA